MEHVLAGGKLQFCRTAFLSHIQDVRDMLILGEGNGRFLLECRKALGAAEITCVDSSPRMLEAARRRLLSHGFSEERTRFVQADALTWTPPARFFDARSMILSDRILSVSSPTPLNLPRTGRRSSEQRSSRVKHVWSLVTGPV